MVLELVFETHSLTEDNEAGIATGWLPGRLSPEGRRLASELGARRRNDGISAVFVSDLARAVETARIAFDGSGLPLFEDARLRECNYGEMNGAPVASIARERSKRIDLPFPGGQSYQDVVLQTAAFLDEILAERDGQRVLVISHSANKWALDCLLAGAILTDLVDAPFGWQEGWEYTLGA
ncbi:MAG: histidine phosphatase family protein [Tepidiformaceae bacterium]